MIPIGSVVRCEQNKILAIVIDHEKDECRLVPLSEQTNDCSAYQVTVNNSSYSLLASRTFWQAENLLELIGESTYEQCCSVLRQVVLTEAHNFYKQSTMLKPPSPIHVPASGKVVGDLELENLIDSAMDLWLTTGRYNDAFEKKFALFTGIGFALTCNSGSSANLLAVSALTSPKLGERALKPGDEVITVAAGFPTTVNPLLQQGLIPVFVDVDIPTYNIDPCQIENAVSPKTKAIMIAHTLGNPFDIDTVLKVARKYDLWIVEDCCDALGSCYDSQLEGENRLVGTFGDIATFSFYPAHHITMGEGGLVVTDNPKLKRIIESFRDWGRDCWCPPGCDNSCTRRFEWQLGTLPKGYDHKYIYSHIGFNLKITDMQAAVGLAQLERL